MHMVCWVCAGQNISIQVSTNNVMIPWNETSGSLYIVCRPPEDVVFEKLLQLTIQLKKFQSPNILIFVQAISNKKNGKPFIHSHALGIINLKISGSISEQFISLTMSHLTCLDSGLFSCLSEIRTNGKNEVKSYHQSVTVQGIYT